MLDYHVHTTRSIDCDTPVAESCRAAIAAGVTEIAFTDHVEFEHADMGFGFYDYAGYQDDIDRARDAFEGQLTILRGAELDFNTRTRDDVERWLNEHTNFDFIIGSVHYGDGGEIIFPQYFDSRTLTEVFSAYYEQLFALAETGWFDTLGHIDLPKRYAPVAAGDYDPMDHADQLRSVFQMLIRNGTSFEINTSGLRQSPRTSMPAAQVVALYVAEGGRLITTGTDSHFANHVGSGLKPALEMLSLCGIDKISSFRNRVRTQVSISRLLVG
ncbi:MAG: histidinol-phosphatase HisJ family protein [Thermomicrobiales bacterium]